MREWFEVGEDAISEREEAEVRVHGERQSAFKLDAFAGIGGVELGHELEARRLEYLTGGVEFVLGVSEGLGLGIFGEAEESSARALVLRGASVESLARVVDILEVEGVESAEALAELGLDRAEEHASRVGDLLDAAHEPVEDGAADGVAEGIAEAAVEALDGLGEVELVRVRILQAVAVLGAVLGELGRALAELVHVRLQRAHLHAEERRVLHALERSDASRGRAGRHRVDGPCPAMRRTGSSLTAPEGGSSALGARDRRLRRERLLDESLADPYATRRDARAEAVPRGSRRKRTRRKTCSSAKTFCALSATTISSRGAGASVRGRLGRSARAIPPGAYRLRDTRASIAVGFTRPAASSQARPVPRLRSAPATFSSSAAAVARVPSRPPPTSPRASVRDVLSF